MTRAAQDPECSGQYRTQRPSTTCIPVAHLIAARPAARRAAVRTQTPLTRCIPAPQASRINVSISSGCGGESGMACADDARATAKAVAINLVMFSPQCGPGRDGIGGNGGPRPGPAFR